MAKTNITPQVEPKTHKIAIVKPRSFVRYDSDGYEYETKIIESITEWETVSDKEFDLLKKAGVRFDFAVIEQPTDPEKFIAKTIADYKRLIKKEEEDREAERLERERKALERKQKRDAKARAKKIELFNQLKKEIEG